MKRIEIYDAEATARLLGFDALVGALGEASKEHDAGAIHSPVRVGVPLADGGVFLSMPASARDLAIHKLVSVSPHNIERKLPTLFGTVTVCDGTTGEPEFILDGPTLTGRRTAALSMLGIRLLHPARPEAVVIIGTGQQARHHAAAIAELFPGARIFVKGRSREFEQAFCRSQEPLGVRVHAADGAIPTDADTVITVTTSNTPVYTEAGRPDRLVIGVGAFTPDAAEIAPDTVRASAVFVDDIHAARAEAGDLIQADVDWETVRSIGSVGEKLYAEDKPRLFKTVGSGAWDLAACRVARSALAR